MKKSILIAGLLVGAVAAAAVKNHKTTEADVNAAIDARLHAMLVKLNAQKTNQ
jgi:hypothetical protein